MYEHAEGQCCFMGDVIKNSWMSKRGDCMVERIWLSEKRCWDLGVLDH